jgi:hypothetical protein
MFKLKTMTIEINNTANSDTLTLTTTEGLNIENLINFLNNQNLYLSLPQKTKDTKKLSNHYRKKARYVETWENAFNRCSKQSLDLIKYIFIKKCAFGESFPVYREDLLKDLKVKPEGLNGRIGSINRCFWTLNKDNPVIIYYQQDTSYDIDSNEFYELLLKVYKKDLRLKKEA